MLLSIKEIASWQLPTLRGPNDKIRAELPALQRGAVWRAHQVEALWDSVLRGFPIGAFLLAPFHAERGTKRLSYAIGEENGEPTHHLLDGQQRSNALALGFLDPWSWPEASMPIPAALWLDLQAPDSKDERDFVFRFVTRAHPWGYRANATGSEGPRLSAAAIRNAARAYKHVYTGAGEHAPGNFSLADVWPWDAHAPVPFCFLVEAIEQSADVRKHVLQRLTDLPYWGHKLENIHGENWRQNVLDALRMGANQDSTLHRAIAGLESILGKNTETPYQIPALMIQNIGAAPTESSTERMDSVETLFIRVNAGGTRLDGEELVYSILKSIWPDAEKSIATMNTRLAQPSRIVILASRLVLANEKNAFQDRPPAAPDVARFRRLINGLDNESKGFRGKLKAFFETGRAADLFAKAQDILTKNKQWGLPTVLAADIAQRTPQIMFLFLRWIDKMLQEGQEPTSLSSNKLRSITGVITALAWFAENHDYCVTNLWHDLQASTGQTLRFFFERNLDSCYQLRNNKLSLLPLVPPKVLKSVIDANFLNRRGIGTPTSWLWENWNWANHLTVSTDDKHVGDKLHNWYKRNFAKPWARPNHDEGEAADSANSNDLNDLYRQAWANFINKLWGERRLLLFAQRKWLGVWFPAFDPTSADHVDDCDRPWDFDHIHPSAHIERKRNVPAMIREWHGSIGNLRAWPLQANRGDGDQSPRHKLESYEKLGEFGIHSTNALLEASFIDDDLNDWQRSCPDPVEPGYLGKTTNFRECPQHLMQAILTRFLRIYEVWYETFEIGALHTG